MPRAGSRILPPRRQSGLVMALGRLHGGGFGWSLWGLVPPREEIEHRHAHGDAVRDLLEDHRVLAVRDVLRDLDAPVHGTGVHHGHVGARAAEPLPRDAVDPGVLAERRVERAAL